MIALFSEPWVGSVLTLSRPWVLLLLLPLGGLSWTLAVLGRRTVGWRQLVDPALQPQMLQPGRSGKCAGATLLALAMMILALAGPIWRVPEKDVPFRPQQARILVADLSAPSSEARNEWLQTTVRGWLLDLPHGHAGIVTYGAEAYLASPLTTDRATLELIVPELVPSVIPVPGNDPRSALELAALSLQASGATEREIWWLTAAGQASLSVLPDLKGARLQVIHLTEELSHPLADVVRMGGGRYMKAGTGAIDWSPLLNKATWRPAPEYFLVRDWTDLGYWLLLPAAVFSAWGVGAVLRSVGGVLIAVGLIAGGTAETHAASADRLGYQLLKDGKYVEASEVIRDPGWLGVAYFRQGRFAEAASQWEKIDSAEGHYNRGVALARKGDLIGALAAFEMALERNSNDKDARFNRDLIASLLRPPPPVRSPDSQGHTPPPRGFQSPVSESDAYANQLRRRLPPDPGGALRQRLLLEHARRQRGAQ